MIIASLSTLALNIIISLLIFLAGRLLIRWIRSITKIAIERSHADTGVVQFIDSLLKFVLYALLLFIIVQRFGVSSSSVAAIIASGGVALSLALQGSLSNLAGGVLILMQKPFVVGDYIKEDSHGNEGTVQEIHIFYTKLATIDNRIIIVPNGMLSNNSLTNVTSNPERTLELKIGISYKADLKKAKELIEQLLIEDAEVLTEQPYLIFVDALLDSSVQLGLRVKVPTASYHPVRWRLLENIKLTFDENGIEIPYPQMDIHMK